MDNLHKGHRQKMRARFFANGLNGMADHNVLELLLFFGIPQKDTNELAHRLLERFGSLADVFRAEEAELRAVGGMTENAVCLLRLILPLYQRYCLSLREARPVFSSAAQVEEFVRPYFLDATKERVIMLCLDDRRQLLALRTLNQGSLADVMLDLRAIAAAVLETRAKGVVLVHNHPSGIALPSGDDISATRQINGFLKMLQVNLLDHLILTDSSSCSLAGSRRYCSLFLEDPPQV